mgnify:CR=1 FL=1|jgi:leucyl/phenylalanyl-tRNA--protein transferase|tara:strand:+ start:160666 stop:161364 length:699 start_codon:yes stop_codon:yes gene_type:complete
MASSFAVLDSNAPEFPGIEAAATNPNGLLAIGGNLDTDTLLLAYRSGIFPWYDQDSQIMWWSPDPREILLPDDQHWSRTMRRSFRDARFRISTDTNFEAVVEACSRNEEAGVWITDEMRSAYLELNRLGIAHSLEVWQEDTIIGGLYGVAIGSAFCGESMFHRVSNSSKLAFLCLADQLFAQGFEFIDCQFETDHLRSLGTRSVSRALYRKYLDKALLREPAWPSTFGRNIS